LCFFFKQKTAYEIRNCDWSSDVCSSDLYDDLGIYDKAFHHFESGNNLDVRGEPCNADGHSYVVDRIMAVFNKNFLSTRRGMGSESDMPVFIVGIPRSGTTLAEQILSSHPQVFGAGELAEIGGIANQLVDTIGGTNTYPEAATDLDALNAVMLADGYVGFLKGVGGKAVRVYRQNAWKLHPLRPDFFVVSQCNNHQLQA